MGDTSHSFILSANTDGLLIKLAPGDEARVQGVIAAWEKATGFAMESNHLSQYRRLNVNNYIAIGEDGSVKSKGSLNCEPGLVTTPDELVVARAIAAWMKDGTPVEVSIRAAAEARDLFVFATTFTTQGPGFRSGDRTYGNVVRAYRSKAADLEPIVTQAHGKVGEQSNRGGYRIFEDLDVWPDDLDVEAYVAEAEAIIAETNIEIDAGRDARNGAEAARLEGLGFEVRGLGAGGVARPKGEVGGSLKIGIVVAPRHDLVAVGTGVMGDETLLLAVHEQGVIQQEIHTVAGMKPKALKALKEAGAVTNGIVPVLGDGLEYELLRGVAPKVAPTEAVEAEPDEAADPVEIGPVGNDEFLAAIFGDAAGEAYVISTTTPPDTEDAKAKAAMWAGGPAKFSRGLYLEADANNYCSISTFEPDDEGVYRRTADAFAALHCVMLDDIGTKVGEPGAVGFGRPTARIETSPGNYQLIYRLREPLADQGLAEALIEAVTRSSGQAVTDKGAGGINRVFRLPVGWNNKVKYGETPFPVRLAEWNPGVSYAPVEIAAWLGVKQLVPVRGGGHRAAAEGDRAMVHPIVEAFRAAGKLLGERPKRTGWIDVECPWCDDHTGRKDDGAAVKVRDNGTWAFRCQHGHCSEVRMVEVGGVMKPVLARSARSVADWFRVQGAKVPDPGRPIWGSAALHDAAKDAKAQARGAQAEEESDEAGDDGDDPTRAGDDEAEDPGESDVDVAARLAELIATLDTNRADKEAFNEAVRLVASLDTFDQEVALNELRRVTKFTLAVLRKAVRDAVRASSEGTRNRAAGGGRGGQGGQGGDGGGDGEDGGDFDDMSHGEMAERLIDSLMRQGVAPVSDNDSLYTYSPAGVWSALEATAVRSDIMRRFPGQKKNSRHSDAVGIYKAALDKAARPGFFASAPIGVTCPGGFWKIQDGELVQVAHSASNRSLHLLKYDPDLSGPPAEFLRVLREGLASPRWDDGEDLDEVEDAARVDEQVRMLQQLFGATLMGLMPRLQRAVFLMGAAASFKSGTLRVLESLFDQRSVSSVPAKRLEDQYYLAQIAGKRLNSVGEAEHDVPLPAAEFKGLVGGDKMTGREPYGRPFEFVNTAVLWFAGNQFFITKDQSEGFWRRWAIVRFKTGTPAERRDGGLVDRILADEGGKIIAWAMEGALDFLANGLAVSRDHKDAATVWTESSSSVASWLTEGEASSPRARGEKDKPLRTKTAYENYLTFCSDSRRQALQKQKFFVEMERLGHRRRKSDGYDVFPKLTA